MRCKISKKDLNYKAKRTLFSFTLQVTSPVAFFLLLLHCFRLHEAYNSLK